MSFSVNTPNIVLMENKSRVELLFGYIYKYFSRYRDWLVLTPIARRVFENVTKTFLNLNKYENPIFFVEFV